jgi:hypothetical protein
MHSTATLMFFDSTEGVRHMLPCQEDITTQVNLSTVENIDSSLVKLYIRHVYVENLKICTSTTRASCNCKAMARDSRPLTRSLDC